MCKATQGAIRVEKLDDYRWLIPKSSRPGMRTDALIFASERLLEAIKQPLLLLSAEQRSIAIRALRTTVRRHVASAQWRHFAGLFAPVLTAIQNREGHKAAKSKALIKAQCVALRYRPRA